MTRVALVTGASRGIGQAITHALGQAGHLVIGTATTEAGAQAISESLRQAGLQGEGMQLEVTESGACEALVDAVIKKHGHLDILVNNAGITRDNLAMRMKDEEWDAVIQTNLTAVFKLNRAVLRPMMKARWGRIVQITSVVGVSGNPGQANYAAAKAGVAGMSRALAREIASRGITVNCVAPGFIDTDMTRALSEEQIASLTSQIPAQRLGKPSDIAASVVFLASEDAGYITGITLNVNGGMVMN
ncbi:MAG: 3-oxoacyl-[acyl-carrier-protein] reductase [Pseudomonadota bacterium]|jgi:3-oxoacyl-[acyl-carrier protein] reductase